MSIAYWKTHAIFFMNWIFMQIWDSIKKFLYIISIIKKSYARSTSKYSAKSIKGHIFKHNCLHHFLLVSKEMYNVQINNISRTFLSLQLLFINYNVSSCNVVFPQMIVFHCKKRACCHVSLILLVWVSCSRKKYESTN